MNRRKIKKQIKKQCRNRFDINPISGKKYFNMYYNFKKHILNRIIVNGCTTNHLHARIGRNKNHKSFRVVILKPENTTRIFPS